MSGRMVHHHGMALRETLELEMQRLGLGALRSEVAALSLALAATEH